MKFDDIKKLQQKKYREAFGYFLVEGEHLILELQKAAASNTALAASELYVTEKFAQWPSAFKTHVIHERQLAQIAETQTPQGIVALVPTAALQNNGVQSTERAIYLHEVQDPGNLGAILRTLAWFGNTRCLLSPGSVDPFNAKVIRASMGAIFHVPLELDVPLAPLSTRFKRIACLDMQGDNVQAPDFKSHECFVFGNEARGLPRTELAALAARPFAIAGGGAIESLNLAAAVNICMYELNR